VRLYGRLLLLHPEAQIVEIVDCQRLAGTAMDDAAVGVDVDGVALENLGEMRIIEHYAIVLLCVI